nr:hypothetical protein [Tanacetum cinerariifolium]
ANTESDPEEAPSEVEEFHSLGFRVPLMGEEFEAFESIGTRTDSSHSSTSSDFTAPLSPDHPLMFHLTQNPPKFRSIVGPHDTEEDESLVADDEKEGHGLGDEDHGLDNERALRRHELAVEEDKVPSTFEGVRTLAYAPPVAPVQTSPSLKWSLGSLRVSPSSPVECQARAGEDRRNVWSFVDTQLADMSWDMYDDHKLIHDMLVQRAAMQRKLQEMRGRVTALEHEKGHREQ